LAIFMICIDLYLQSDVCVNLVSKVGVRVSEK
jgi:hypothetical protein